MTSAETITLTRAEYDALVARNDELEDRLATLEADDGSRIPHEVALAIMRGQGPIRALRDHLGFTLRGLKSGSASALSRLADALGTTVDVLISMRR